MFSLLIYLILCFVNYRKVLSGFKLSNQYESCEEFMFDKLIQYDVAKHVPGLEFKGTNYFINEMTKAIGDVQIKTIGINEELSEHISYNRIITDFRHPLCKKEKYDIDSLPSMSMIIIFHDEPYSVILRTVHNVLNTVPKKLLKDLILVDDASEMEILRGGKLKYFIKSRLPNQVVQLHRIEER